MKQNSCLTTVAKKVSLFIFVHDYIPSFYKHSVTPNAITNRLRDIA